MAIKITPRIFIGSTEIACTAAAADSEPTAIDRFSIDWGRRDYHDSDAEPASLELSLTDSTGVWARHIRENSAIGRIVRIQWVGERPSGTKVTVTQFRGRISRVSARPLKASTPAGVRRWRVDILAADMTASMGGMTVTADWGRDTMLVRAVNLVELAKRAGAGLEAVMFWPGYREATTAPMEIRGTSPLELMGQFYSSMGNDSWAYDPHSQKVRQVIRLSQPLSMALGSFDDSRGDVIPVPADITIDDETYPGIGIGACDLAGDPEVTLDPATDINRLETAWRDHSTGWNEWTTVREEISAGDAPRAMRWDSWLDDGRAIDPTLENVWQRVREEGRRPRHPDITLPATDMFTTERVARWWLACWENTRPAYLAGSLAWGWLMGKSTDYPPVVAPIGGTTTYHAGRGYSVTMRVHWIHNTKPPGRPVTWADLPQRQKPGAPSVPWWWGLIGLPTPPAVGAGQRTPERDLTWGGAADSPGYHFGVSVTWADMIHLPAAGAQITDHLG